LIEKGADASIFNLGRRSGLSLWKVLVLNIALLLMAIGLGIFIASILDSVLGIDEEVAYPGTIFLMAGIGLYAGFTLTKKLEKES
jgi:flagellar biosynthesis protein FliQ